jgi:hypothetical protein
MADSNITSQALELLGRHFELPALDNEGSNEEEKARLLLIDLLTPVIRRMLDQSFEQLLNILYRIDLPEPKVVALLEQSAPEQVAANLTAAIVDRQLEKVRLREKYRNF